MPELRFVLAGTDTHSAAAVLITALEGGEGIKATTTPVADLPETGRKAIDPISLAALIVSIPSAALAVSDIVDRIRQRRTAQAVIDTARRLRFAQAVETYLLAPDQTRAIDQTPHAVADLEPDTLLDLVATMESPP